MANIKQTLIFLSSIVVFLYVFYVLGAFILFLSAPRQVPLTYSWVFNLLDNASRWDMIFGPLFFNTLYLMAFVLQHSIMKSSLVKQLIGFIGVASAERTIYNLTSSLCLHYLVQHWLPAQSVVLWQLNVEGNRLLWWAFALVHIFAWFVIFGGSINMDAPEMLGIKQPYYNIKGYAEPTAYKDLYAHVRHPSFSGVCIILWATNLMSLDRLLLAVMLTAYMLIAWTTDRSDVSWRKHQLQRKINGWKMH